MARKSAAEAPLYPDSPFLTHKRVYTNDLPSADDVIGVVGMDGKTYTFVSLMQCGITDYAMLRERDGKTANAMAALVTPEITTLYYVERHSTPRVTPAVAQAERVRSSVMIAKTPEVSQPDVKQPVVTEKRGRGRPRKNAAPAAAAPKKRGRPRKTR